MWVWSCFHIIFIIFAHIFNKVTCQEKFSFSIVISNADSMYDDIEQVKKNAKEISQVVFEEASQIKNVLLVTFNDSAATLVTATENQNIFKAKINEVQIYKRHECPERSMKGILLALSSSLPGSSIYVFTDAPAKDYTLIDDVKSMCRDKHSQIVFVLTGYCGTRSEDMYKDYYDIAAACSGLVFEVQKHEVNQILSTIKETIKGNKTVLTTTKTQPWITTKVEFTIDDQIQNAIVVVSGLNVFLSVSGPSAKQENLMRVVNAKAVKLSALTPGSYTAKVWAASETSVYIIGRTNFTKLESNVLEATQSPFTTTPTLIKPVVSISEGKTIKVTYAQPMTLTCKVTAYPKPKIEWIDEHGVTLKSQSSVEEAPYKYISYLKLPQVLNNGRVICRAQNNLGARTETVNVKVGDPFVIRNVPKAITRIRYGRQETLRCDITSPVPMHIRWYATDEKPLVTSNRYSVSADGTMLTIKRMDFDMVHTYRCVAALNNNKDRISVHETLLKITGLKKPKVFGDTSIKIIKGEPVTLNCQAKGTPKPTIKLYFKAKNFSDFTPLSENTMWGYPGLYKCVAQNSVGRDELLTEVIIEYAPVIISSDSVILEGIEGDKSLRIPCETQGVPKPSVTWKLNENTITTNSKYVVTDEALLIKEPTRKDSKSYTCEAKNYRGEARASFRVNVELYLKEFGEIKDVNILRATSMKLKCDIADPSQTVRWFRESEDTNVTGNYFDLENVNKSSESNYTCRVNDVHGTTRKKTYAVIVGDAPYFINAEHDPEFVWSGTESRDDRLLCDVEGEPTPDFTWIYNGKLLKDQTSAELILSDNWGHYRCNASNAHGAVQRDFEVVSTDCFISRHPADINKMPLILTPTSIWPTLDSKTGYLVVKSGHSVKFYCPDGKNKKNTLKSLPLLVETTAMCDKEDTFLVGDTPYKISDLQCTEEASPMVYERHMKCLGETSELLRVGYEVNGFLETYEVCLNLSNKIPLYTRVLMSSSSRGPGTHYGWSQYHGFVNRIDEKVRYTCNSSLTSGCYNKTQLVKVRDFIDGPAQKSTFLDPLNAVPYWNHVDMAESTRTWDIIDDMIRTRLSIYKQFVSWSGTHMLQQKNGHDIPRYLWKVLRFDEKDSLAIVYVNGPSPSNVDILCKNICSKAGAVPWITEVNKHMYCCNMDDFLGAFELRGTTVGEPLEAALDKILSKRH